MDVTKPIRRGILTLSKGRQLWYDIRYEKLPNYCFWCGGFDHVEKDCGAAFEEGAEEDDERRFANLKMVAPRESFTRVANAQRWSGGPGQGGPRFVHRGSSGKGVPRWDSSNAVRVVDDDVGVDLSVLHHNVRKDHAGSVVNPGLAQSLNSLCITVEDNVGVKAADIHIQQSTKQVPKEPRGWGEDLSPGLNGIVAEVGITNLGLHHANLVNAGNMSAPNASLDLVGTALEGGVSQVVEPEVNSSFMVEGGGGSTIGSCVKGSSSIGSLSQAEDWNTLRREQRDDQSGIGAHTEDLTGVPLRRWKRILRQSKVGSEEAFERSGGKRGLQRDMEVEVVAGGKKSRQVDADIPVKSTAGPGFQACRSQ